MFFWILRIIAEDVPDLSQRAVLRIAAELERGTPDKVLCVLSNFLDWLLRVSASSSSFSAQPWPSPNNSTMFFPYSFRRFQADYCPVMMGSIGGASRACGTMP